MSRSDIRQQAARLVIAKVVADWLKRYQQVIREQIEPELVPGEKVKATLPNGTPIGNVQLTEEAARVRCNITEVTAWVKQHHPEQIQENVSDAYLTHLFTLAKKYGHAFDKETGEVIPGIELERGSPSFRVTPSTDGRAMIENQYAGLIELPDAD
jgi:hypothetical protein